MIANKVKRFMDRFKKTDWKNLYEQEQKNSEKWEFKYNKLFRELKTILEKNGDK